MMKPSTIDRLCVIAVAGGLAFWLTCLLVCWATLFDPSGPGASWSLLMPAAALAVGAGALRGGARLLQRVLSGSAAWGALQTELARARRGSAGHEEGKALARLLAAGLVMAAVCGALTTLAIFGARSVTAWLGRAMSATAGEWHVLQAFLSLVGWLPFGAGAAALLMITAVLRGGSGRDVYATALREWLIGAAGGLAVAAIVWTAGGSMLGAGLIVAVLMLAGGPLALQRKNVAVRPRFQEPPAPTPVPLRLRLGVAAGYACLALAARVQARLGQDVWGLCLDATWAWLAGSLLLLAVGLRRADNRASSGPDRQPGGPVLGVGACLLMQVAMSLSALAGGGGVAVLGVLSAAGQLPLVVLGAMVLARQRRALALAGGSASLYLTWSAGGLAAGCAIFSLAAALPGGGAVLLALALGVLTREVIHGLAPAGGPAQQIQWSVWGGVLMLCLTAAVLTSAHLARGALGSVRVGPTHTLVHRAADGRAPQAAEGCLPLEQPWQSPAVSRALARTVPGRRARWLAWVHSDRLLPSWPREVRIEAVDQPPLPARPCCDGVLIAPVPLDHPRAWLSYNTAALARCHDLVRPGGLVILRTQADSQCAHAVLQLARTFQIEVGSGWAVLEVGTHTIDVLLVGPASAAARPDAGGGAFVVALEDLLSGPAADARPLRASNPCGGDGLTREDLVAWLRTLQRER